MEAYHEMNHPDDIPKLHERSKFALSAIFYGGKFLIFLLFLIINLLLNFFLNSSISREGNGKNASAGNDFSFLLAVSLYTYIYVSK
tara:strand:- start:246 stop:503 length:258 start_codon:yes stop_codon:yes gene_type:complete